MKTSFHLQIFIFLAAAVVVAGLTGCLAASDNQKIISGKNISPDTFAQVVAGKTQDFVSAQLGEPSSKVKGDNGDEVWNWRYSETTKSSSGFIFIFYSGNRTENLTIRHVEFKDNVVVKTWTD